MKILKTVLISLLVFAVIILPHLAVFGYTVFISEPRYDATFVGELDEKFKTVKGGKGIAYTVPMTSTIGVAIYQFLANTTSGGLI